ncbi:hypothetical protein SESBI_12766 [Sesbania bispinosa]|nr:hypothetical protein SESBI_12766 [Sesbania bispinosa]
MPMELELGEFFAITEKDIQLRFFPPRSLLVDCSVRGRSVKTSCEAMRRKLSLQ